MNIKSSIIKEFNRRGVLKTSELVKKTGFSRAYLNRFLQQLRKEGEIVHIGKANQARYVLSNSAAMEKARRQILKIHKVVKNLNLSEDAVLAEIKKETGIFWSLPQNVSAVIDYTFTEMLNNAIEHSKSPKIEIFAEKTESRVLFNVIDRGIGIFKNIMQKRGLKTELEAIQDLLKGKQTTAPKKHTGEGIFFTSRAADILIIQSSQKKLIFENLIGDVFIRDIKYRKGTKVTFQISLRANTNLMEIFRKYAGNAFTFEKSDVRVSLYKMGADPISRSQARRILVGLEKFKTITLDFKNVDTVGQGFADEIFRVWQNLHTGIKVLPINANQNVSFMIRRALPPKES